MKERDSILEIIAAGWAHEHRTRAQLAREARGLPACPMCGAFAIVSLTHAQLAVQPDGTTHVCHPMLHGCNHGFAAADQA